MPPHSSTEHGHHPPIPQRCLLPGLPSRKQQSESFEKIIIYVHNYNNEKNIHIYDTRNRLKCIPWPSPSLGLGTPRVFLESSGRPYLEVEARAVSMCWLRSWLCLSRSP